jgi:hypothetical protein
MKENKIKKIPQIIANNYIYGRYRFKIGEIKDTLRSILAKYVCVVLLRE